MLLSEDHQIGETGGEPTGTYMGPCRFGARDWAMFRIIMPLDNTSVLLDKQVYVQLLNQVRPSHQAWREERENN